MRPRGLSPGSRRLDAREQTRVDGIELPDDLDRRLLEAAGAR